MHPSNDFPCYLVESKAASYTTTCHLPGYKRVCSPSCCGLLEVLKLFPAHNISLLLVGKDELDSLWGHAGRGTIVADLGLGWRKLGCLLPLPRFSLCLACAHDARTGSRHKLLGCNIVKDFHHWREPCDRKEIDNLTRHQREFRSLEVDQLV